MGGNPPPPPEAINTSLETENNIRASSRGFNTT